MTKRLLAMVALSAVLLMSSGCNKLRARDQLNKGVQAYKAARYEQAIEFFKNAVSFDPNLSRGQALPRHRLCAAVRAGSR